MNQYVQMPNVLTAKDIQEYLKLGRCKVQELLSTGEIPSVRIGHQYRVFATDLIEYMRRNMRVNNFDGGLQK